MHTTTLTTTLLLLLAAAVSLTSAAALPPGLNRAIGPSPKCRRIDAQATTAQERGTTGASGLRRLNSIDRAAGPGALSRRDRPDACGILRGPSRSDAFDLTPNQRWNAYWVDDRVVIGAHVLLWELGGSEDHMVASAPMHQRQLRPFVPERDRRYVIELWAVGPDAPSAVMSWYFATQ